MKKPWGGRFKTSTSKTTESFTESISFDRRLWRYDIEGSIAHAKMLAKQGIISEDDSKRIIEGLKEIANEIEGGRFKFRFDLEDIHMNIETALAKKIGDAAGKLHTARSRNDQIALDLRLYLRDESKDMLSLINRFQKTLLDIASKHINSLMPGYTHMQRAQPVLLSHHLLAYIEMLHRDKDRFKDTLKRINILPLGAGAIAGTTFPIDRMYIAKLLNFDDVTQNSIDSVSDRDFVIEFLSDASILMMHLSRLAEEIVLWSTEEFRFIQLPDAFATGSSAMPQKKNPDIAELVRGKTGRVYGNLFSILTVMKGLPLSYNRDLQEDKPSLFDTIDTLKACLNILNEMLPEIKFNTKRMYETASDGYSTATDIAEYLVKKGLPFRKAHEITGKLVLHCISKNRRLDKLTIKELKKFSPLISDDIYPIMKIEKSLEEKRSTGGTSPVEVKRQIKRIRRILDIENKQ
ncbi:MAG: argininosuccinate lyase [Nitrospirae bacterium]|nr:argininosuccinate lyase [Nitrospirota bacterium]